MSWKILVSAGLLCVVASPALAAPTASAKLLGLDTNGNWVWSVGVTPDATAVAAGNGAVATEIGVTASQRNLVSAAKNATNFPTDNPGTPIGAGFPINTNTTAIGVQTLGNNVAANLGSDELTVGLKEAFRVHTQGPTSVALSTTITLNGAYAGNGRLAQAGVNSDTVTGANVGAVLGGNANLSDHVDVGDLAILGSHYDTAHAHPGQHWQTADFTGDGFVDVGDLAVLGSHYNQADPNWVVQGAVNLGVSPGAGAGSVGAVPEPASIVLLGLGGLFVAACGVRRGR
jgi:hypothetical protein